MKPHGIVCCSALLLAQFAGAQTIIDRARAAVGTQPAAGSWNIKATTISHGINSKLELIVDQSGRFYSKTVGLLPEEELFDGKDYWTKNWSGAPHKSPGYERDAAILNYYIETGLWCQKSSPLTLIELPSTQTDSELEISWKPGMVKAKLTLDKATALPKTVTYWGPSGSVVCTYSDYKKVDGIPVARKVIIKDGDGIQDTEIKSVSRSSKPARLANALKNDQSRIKFDQKASREIEIKRVFDYMFVKPKLNGKEGGWFFLDSGAEAMVLDPKVAKALNAKKTGKEAVSGVVATVNTEICRGLDFQLGPVTMKDTVFFELDLSSFGKALAMQIDGIVGYDFISRVSLDIDPKKPTITINEPGKTGLPEGANWTPFVFDGNIPCLECKFEDDKVGMFHLDTGSTANVDFCTPAVEKYNLLDGRNVVTSATGGAGGNAESKKGHVEWFELAGTRFNKPIVGLQTTKIGDFASPYYDGNVGMGFMGTKRIILDYQNSRLAFAEPSK